MLKFVVCMKQVPMVSELPWDNRTGTLKRDLAQGMMDPGSRYALEAALQLKAKLVKAKLGAGKVSIIGVSMGPPMAEEVLYEARALGVDTGFLLSDPAMAGADTFITTQVLAAFIKQVCPDVDLVFCGVQSADSETAQVGPQLAEELDIPAVAYARSLTITEDMLRVERQVDDYSEILEMQLPGLVSIDSTQERFTPRYVPLDGVEMAFESNDVHCLGVQDLELADGFNALVQSPTRIMDVYSPTTEKQNHVLKGAVKRSVDTLFDQYGKLISGAMGKDLKTHEHGGGE